MNIIFLALAVAAMVLLIVSVYLIFRLYRTSLWLMRRSLTKDMLRRELLNHRQQAEARKYLAKLLKLDPEDLPPAGGWAASADFLIILAEYILSRKPATIIEFGSGLTTIVCARCTEINGRGQVITYDHDSVFAAITRDRLGRLSLPHDIRTVALVDSAQFQYPGKFYDIGNCPDAVDLIVVDGPPIAIHPETRGGVAPAIFARLSDGGAILLDDAGRDGERRIVERWRQEYPAIRFSDIDTEKGTVIGIKTPQPALTGTDPARQSL